MIVHVAVMSRRSALDAADPSEWDRGDISVDRLWNRPERHEARCPRWMSTHLVSGPPTPQPPSPFLSGGSSPYTSHTNQVGRTPVPYPFLLSLSSSSIPPSHLGVKLSRVTVDVGTPSGHPYVWSRVLPRRVIPGRDNSGTPTHRVPLSPHRSVGRPEGIQTPPLGR